MGYIGTRIHRDVAQPQPDKASTGYNPIVELAKETGTPLHRWKENTLLVDGQGQMVAPSEANKALKQVWDILERAIEHSTNHSQELRSSESLYSFFEACCDQAFQCGDMTVREVDLVPNLPSLRVGAR